MIPHAGPCHTMTALGHHLRLSPDEVTFNCLSSLLTHRAWMENWFRVRQSHDCVILYLSVNLFHLFGYSGSFRNSLFVLRIDANHLDLGWIGREKAGAGRKQDCCGIGHFNHPALNQKEKGFHQLQRCENPTV